MTNKPDKPTLLANFQDLLNLLEKDNLPHRADAERQQVELPTKSGSLEGELLILWDARSFIVQCIQPLPFEVPEARIGAVERAIAYINHALVLPGFGLNHINRVLYYRLSVPRRSDGTMSAEELQLLFRTTASTAGDFYLPLLGVALEDKSPEQVITEAASLKGEHHKPEAP